MNWIFLFWIFIPLLAALNPFAAEVDYEDGVGARVYLTSFGLFYFFA